MWPIVWFFFVVVSAIRYPQERCSQNDCSAVLQPFQNVSCLMIHKSTDCMQYISNLTEVAEISLESEEEAKFSTSVSPYTAEFNIANNKTWEFSAINISFAVHKKGVDSLAIKIKHDNSNMPICRIFNFRNQRFFRLPVSFFYDCFSNLTESKMQNVQMDIISLPSNEYLSYYVYIPHIDLKRTRCDWRPVIMVFCGSLANGVVKVKFSRPPSQLNISFCTVELVAHASNDIFSNEVSSNNTEGMLVTEFTSVSYGSYAVVVYLESCQGAKTEFFQVGRSKPVMDIVTVICICIIIVFMICSFAVYRYCYLSHKLSLTVKRALLVYSYDNQLHEKFVTAFVGFLNETTRLKVSTIYRNTVDGAKCQTAMKYLKEECNKADLVIFLISQGLLITLDNHDPPQIAIGHKWPTQLKDASNDIIYAFFHKTEFHQKKKCKIRFPYSKKLHITDYIEENTGECFNLPEDFNRFMSFAHGINTSIFSTVLCPLFAVDFNSPKADKYELGEKLSCVPVADENRDVVRFTSEAKMADPESQKSSKESVAESDDALSFASEDERELIEGGTINSVANFEGNSDDVLSEGEDQPLFGGNSPYKEGEIIENESDEFYITK